MASENHLSRLVRDRYGLQRLAIPDLGQARAIAAELNVSAADLHALGLIDEVLRELLKRHTRQRPALLRQVSTILDNDPGEEPVNETGLKFTQEFPPQSVYGGKTDAGKYFGQNRPAALQELLLVHLHNINPAAVPLEALFDDLPLAATAYPALIRQLKACLDEQPGLERGGESLLAILTAPARVSPTSLAGQLEFLINRWGDLLGESFIQRLLRGLDFIREEIRRGGTGGFGGEAPVMAFSGSDYAEYERFSPDRDWMPRLVLLAKNSYVWLEQLSRKYGYWVRTSTRSRTTSWISSGSEESPGCG